MAMTERCADHFWPLLVLIPSIIECGLRALENIDDSLVKRGVFDRAREICDAAHSFPVELREDYLFRIAHDGQVWVVRHHDDLPVFFCRVEDWHEQTNDRFIVEIFLGLVEDDGISLLVDQKVEDQKQCPALPRRELFDWRVLEQ